MRPRLSFTIVAAALLLGASGPAPLGRSTQTFDVYGPVADSATMLERMLSPLAWASLSRGLTASGGRLDAHPLDLSGERFEVYVPPKRPPDGYGLLVFVPASDRFTLPPGWKGALEARGMIFVAADRSGNDQGFLTRRAPLALLAAANIEARYPVDPDRVFVGGFSGGSRVALRLALAFPELFRGAVLAAGSDPLGEQPVGLPASAQLTLVQERSRFAFLTGAKDPDHLEMDAVSAASMRHWCVFGFDTVALPGLGHDLSDAHGLERAFRIVLAPSHLDAAELSACKARTDAEVSGRLERTTKIADGGDRAKARRALLNLDGSVGGFVGPALRDLAERCGCGAFGAQASSAPPRDRR